MKNYLVDPWRLILMALVLGGVGSSCTTANMPETSQTQESTLQPTPSQPPDFGTQEAKGEMTKLIGIQTTLCQLC